MFPITESILQQFLSQSNGGYATHVIVGPKGGGSRKAVNRNKGQITHSVALYFCEQFIPQEAFYILFVMCNRMIEA